MTTLAPANQRTHVAAGPESTDTTSGVDWATWRRVTPAPAPPIATKETP